MFILPFHKTGLMRANKWLVIAVGMVYCRITRADPLPSDHTIYKIPGDRLFCAEGKRRSEMNMESPVKCEFSLPRKQYLLGEPIYGKFKITNTDKKNRVEFSSPYMGQKVSTVSIWRSRWLESDPMRLDEQGKWDELVEVQKVNKGYYEGVPFVIRPFQGKAVILDPGQQYEVEFPINIVQGMINEKEPELESTFRLRWLGGIGFGRPGKYQFYVKYCNLEGCFPYADVKRMMESPDLTPDTPIIVQIEPIITVLGPFELEIVSPEISSVLSNWEDCYLDSTLRVYPYNDLAVENNPKLKLGLELQKQHSAEVAGSLLLTRVCALMSRINVIGDAERKPVEDLLKQLDSALSALGKSPLRKDFKVIRCYLLKALGRTKEAIREAKQIKTPDAEVFIADEAGVKTGDGKK